MIGHSISKDNGSIFQKRYLRREATKGLKELKVLDCFAGKNILWKNVSMSRYLSIDKEKKKGDNLCADNLRILPSLDLSKFNVIDLDSYGVPYAQMKAIFNNGTLKSGTVVIYTAIGSALSTVPKEALKDYGLQKMYKKVKVLFNKLSIEMFYGLLYKNGIKKVYEYRQPGKLLKCYGYFIF